MTPRKGRRPWEAVLHELGATSATSSTFRVLLARIGRSGREPAFALSCSISPLR